MSLIFYILILTAVLLEVAGDFFFKKWSLSDNLTTLLVGFGVYFLGGVLWALSLKYEALSKAIIIFTLLNLILVVFIGLFWFKEQISIWAKIGILLGLTSIVLLNIE